MSIIHHAEFGILHIKLNNPERHNALTHAMLDELHALFTKANQDDKIRVILLKGGSHFFSAGIDMVEYAKDPESTQVKTALMFDALMNCQKPIVAQVQGPCVGEALTMLMYCDLIYVTNESLFSQPSVALAQTPNFGATTLFAQHAGLAKASEKLLLAEPISALEALQMQLITAIVDAQSIDQVVINKLSRLAVLPPNAVQATKRLLRQSIYQNIQQLKPLEAELYNRQASSAEAKEALNAFLEGRKPVFFKEDEEN